MTLNNTKSYKPKYYHIINDLKKEILSGRLKVGDPVPSENTLAKKYNMSRSTVRKALAQLVLENRRYLAYSDFSHLYNDAVR